MATSNDTQELGLRVEGPPMVWIVRDQPVLVVWHADGDGDTKKLLGCLSRDSQPFLRLWMGQRTVQRLVKEQPTEEQQLLITLHLRIRLQPKSKARDMFLVVPAEMLRIGNDDSTFSAVLGPEATKALSASALPTTMRIRFSLGEREATKVFMPARAYPHAVSGTPLDLVLALRSLSEAPRFHVDVNLGSKELQSLSELQKELRKGAFKTPGVLLGSMYQNHGAGVNNWADQGILQDTGLKDRIPLNARRSRKRKHGQVPEQEAGVPPPPYRQTRELPSVSPVIVIPESSPEPAALTKQSALIGRCDSDSCIPETPKPEVDTRETMLSVCEENPGRLLHARNSPSVPTTTSASANVLPEPPLLYGEIVYWLTKALDTCPSVHYNMIAELLRLCAAARTGNADLFWEMRATCTAQLFYESVGTQVEGCSSRSPIARTMKRQEAVDIFRHEHFMLARWMNIVYPGADLEMSMQLQDSARKAKAFLGLDEAVDSKQYAQLEEAFVAHKATCIAIAAAVYGDKALDPGKDIVSKVLAAKLQFQAQPASVSPEVWRSYNNNAL